MFAQMHLGHPMSSDPKKIAKCNTLFQIFLKFDKIKDLLFLITVN